MASTSHWAGLVTLTGDLVTLAPLRRPSTTTSWSRPPRTAGCGSSGTPRCPRPDAWPTTSRAGSPRQAAGTLLPFTVRRHRHRRGGGLDDTYMNIEAGGAAAGDRRHLERRVRAAHRHSTPRASCCCSATPSTSSAASRSSSARTGTTSSPATAIARLGAKQDGVLRNHRRLPDGSLRDTVVFSILETEWPAVRAGLRPRLARAGSWSGTPAYPRGRVRRRRAAADRRRRAARAGGRPGAAHPAHRRQGRRARRDGRRAGRAHRRDPRRQRGRRRGRRRGRHARSRSSTGCGWTPAGSPAWPRRCAQLVALPDPVGDVVRGSRLPNGLQLRQVRVPLGVVGIVYEARPERDRRRRGALPQERQRGAAARVGVGVPARTPRWSPC